MAHPFTLFIFYYIYIYIYLAELRMGLSRPMGNFHIKQIFVYLFLFLKSSLYPFDFNSDFSSLRDLKNTSSDLLFWRAQFYLSNETKILPTRYRYEKLWAFLQMKLKFIKSLLISAFTHEILLTLTRFWRVKRCPIFECDISVRSSSNQLRPGADGSSNWGFYKKIFASKIGPLTTKFQI